MTGQRNYIEELAARVESGKKAGQTAERDPEEHAGGFHQGAFRAMVTAH